MLANPFSSMKNQRNNKSVLNKKSVVKFTTVDYQNPNFIPKSILKVKVANIRMVPWYREGYPMEPLETILFQHNKEKKMQRIMI